MEKIVDRRDEMSLEELLDEAELRFPSQLTRIQVRHAEALEALEWGSSCDEELLEDLADDLRSLLRV